MQGTPANMQSDPKYRDVVQEVKDFFGQQIATFPGGYHQLIVDPGFGFGKTVRHNYQILSSLESFREFGCPVMAGISRKSMINRVLQIQPAEALNGTTVLNTIALLNGADILRVHDVKEAMEAIKLVSEMRS
jgi:dihydropteroate synthase